MADADRRPPFAHRAFSAPARLMNLRLRHLAGGGEEVEVAAVVGLADVLGEHRAVAARIFRRRLLPGGTALRHFLVADVEMNLAGRHVDLDLVAGLHKGERTADETLWCYM